MKNLAILTLAIFMLLVGCGVDAERNDLEVVPVRSIDPSDVDFGDVAAISGMPGEARIVMLGEQTHGDGSTFLAKIRLIKYLHEQHGFDLIAFESGLYDLYAAQRMIDGGEKPSEALSQAIFPTWTESGEFRELLGYLDDRAATGRPVRVAGFDPQFTNRLSREFPSELRAIGGALGGNAVEFERLAELVSGLFDEGHSALEAMSVEEIESAVAAARQRLADSELEEAEYWRQIVASSGNLLVFVKRLPEGTAEVFNMRDAQMAANMEWLARTAYPDRKIIVWAATSHLTRNREVLDAETSIGMIPMGAILDRSMGGEIYVLGFTAGGGASASYATGELWKWGTAPEGSIEEAIGKAGHEFAFVDSSSIETSMPGKRTSWMLGFEPMQGLWNQAVDGVFYIRTMQPATFPGERENTSGDTSR